jgi:hypothetical protein
MVNKLSLITHSKWNTQFHMTKDGKNIPPGQLQYKLSRDSILNMNLPEICQDINVEEYYSGYTLGKRTTNNLKRLIPNTNTGRNGNWKLILIIRADEFHMKGALENTKTGEIALMTTAHYSLDRPLEKRAPTQSFDSDWKISRCKMIAPLFFWDELQRRLKQ